MVNDIPIVFKIWHLSTSVSLPRPVRLLTAAGHVKSQQPWTCNNRRWL